MPLPPFPASGALELSDRGRRPASHLQRTGHGAVRPRRPCRRPPTPAGSSRGAPRPTRSSSDGASPRDTRLQGFFVPDFFFQAFLSPGSCGGGKRDTPVLSIVVLG